MNFLKTILENKRQEVLDAQRTKPRSNLVESEFYRRQSFSLIDALKKKEIGIIAEIKHASPSKGILRNNFNPLEIAHSYVKHDAAALSILTDEKFFQGHLDHLLAVRRTTTVPILRKDFIVDSYQIHEAKANGADAILLIVAALTQSQLNEFHLEANELDLEVMVEVHNQKEVERANSINARLIGINNRDLDTFEVDLFTSARLRKEIPPQISIVSESGIGTAGDVEILIQNGIKNVLIGEVFMRADDPGMALSAMLDELLMVKK